MRTAREQAREIAGLHYRGHSIADIEAAITAALEEKDRELAEAMKLLQSFVAAYMKGKGRYDKSISGWFEAMPGDWPYGVNLTVAHFRVARAFLAKHTHTEKPDGKLQKPLDTHAKPL